MSVKLEDRLLKSSKKNQQFFYDYIDFEVNVNEKKEKSMVNYRSTIATLYEYINHKDIDTISLGEIEEFLLQFNNIRTFNNKLNHLKAFFSYLYSFTTLKFEINELYEITIPSDEIRNAEKREPIPLSIDELVLLRKKLEKNKDYKKLLIFEMMYYHGLDQTEVSQCNINTYDKEKKIFDLENKKIEINERIQYIISFKNVLKPYKSDTTVIYRLNEIGKLLNRTITPTDIKKTRELNFFTCPSCRNDYERNPMNWAILEYSIDNSKWLICKHCAGEYIE